MSVITARTKGKLGINAARAAVKRPSLVVRGAKVAAPAAKLGLQSTKPVAKRRVRRRMDQVDRAAEAVGRTLAVRGPRLAYEFGLAEPPKPKRSAPRVAAGIAIGASAMYLLEPGHGSEHRQKLAQLVS